MPNNKASNKKQNGGIHCKRDAQEFRSKIKPVCRIPAFLHFLPSRRRFRVRAAKPAPLRVADRPTQVMVTPDLPKLGPFALQRGPEAIDITREYADAWLDAPIDELS